MCVCVNSRSPLPKAGKRRPRNSGKPGSYRLSPPVPSPGTQPGVDMGHIKSRTLGAQGSDGHGGRGRVGLAAW